MLKSFTKSVKLTILLTVATLNIAVAQGTRTQPQQQALPKADSTKIPTAAPASAASGNIGANQTPSGVQVQRQEPVDNYKVFQRPKSNIFGSEIFSNGSLSFQPNLRIATPVNYVLGPMTSY